MFPEAEISNGLIHARIYLPDGELGYYRATRFDWSGVVASLTCNGHEFFGPWFDHHDPKKHDGIVGPAEEFHVDDGGLGYAEAPAGGTFLRIGVGVLRKPDEPEYRRFGAYDIVDPGSWTIFHERSRIEFRHVVSDCSGYAYEYCKRLILAKDKPELTIEHCLKNTGLQPIKTTQFNHNFFVIDGESVGPEYVVRFPFLVQTADDLKDLAEIRGTELRYLHEIQRGQNIFVSLEGFGRSTGDHNIVVENLKTGAGVTIQGDQPIHRIVFWCIRTTLCPEPYVAIDIEPDQEMKWQTAYTFYGPRRK